MSLRSKTMIVAGLLSLPLITAFAWQLHLANQAATPGEAYYRQFGVAVLFLFLGFPLTWLFIPIQKAFGPFDAIDDWWLVMFMGGLLLTQWLIWIQLAFIIWRKCFKKDKKTIQSVRARD